MTTAAIKTECSQDGLKRDKINWGSQWPWWFGFLSPAWTSLLGQTLQVLCAFAVGCAGCSRHHIHIETDSFTHPTLKNSFVWGKEKCKIFSFSWRHLGNFSNNQSKEFSFLGYRMTTEDPSLPILCYLCQAIIHLGTESRDQEEGKCTFTESKIRTSVFQGRIILLNQ